MKAHQRKNPARSLRRLHKRIENCNDAIRTAESDAKVYEIHSRDQAREESDRNRLRNLAANRRQLVNLKHIQLEALTKSLDARLA